MAVVVTFNSPQGGATKAVAALETSNAFSDVPNFTNHKPLLMLGQTTGNWET